MLPDRKLNRLRDYDYRSEGLYFITSCVENKTPCFGQIINQEMQLNDFGKIADQQFNWLQSRFQYVFIHAHVVMPNHIHAIIEINPELSDATKSNQKIKSISELIGAYKTTTAKQIRQAGLSEFTWQRSFHDHIIRNEKGYDNILNYILN